MRSGPFVESGKGFGSNDATSPEAASLVQHPPSRPPWGRPLSVLSEQVASRHSAARISGRLRNYLYYSTIIGVFCSLLIVRLDLHMRLMEANLLILCLLVSVTRISPWLLAFLAYMAASGAIGISNGTDAFPGFLVELRAISINALYYYFFFRLIRNDFLRAFLTYAEFAYWFAIIALPVWIANCLLEREYVRLRGLATEPADFCILILPAFYWYSYQFLTTRRHGLKVCIFTLAVVLSASSLGYLSVTFGLLLLLSKRRKHLLAAPLIVIALLTLAYTESPYFRTRLSDTLATAATGDFTGSNLSTYALISNAIVTERVLAESPFIGNGLGSHPISHERFLYGLQGIDFFVGQHLADSNALEAASLTLRVLSEFGFLGYVGVLAFLIHFRVGGKGSYGAISNALLVCFFLKLIRAGQYYPPEQFFFIFIYILNYRQAKREGLIGIAASRPRLAQLIAPLPLSNNSVSDNLHPLHPA